MNYLRESKQNQNKTKQNTHKPKQQTRIQFNYTIYEDLEAETG
jgi:hypothetical protein